MSIRVPNARGCAKIPFEKKRLAVIGAGGSLGATVFGLLQRASALYGTGLAGAERNCPRGVCATNLGAGALNRVLTSSFKLAYAPENLLRLTDMTSVSYLTRTLNNMDAVILGTEYELESRPVTSGTYETNPNSKTNEIYLGGKRGRSSGVRVEDDAAQLIMFRNTLDACRATGTVKHVVVVQTTPKGDSDREYARLLDESGLRFTYVLTGGDVANTRGYTYESGIQNKLDLEAFTLSDGYDREPGYEPGDWMDSLLDDATKVKCDTPLATEDLAALVLQSLMSLDWTKSRILDVGSRGPLGVDDPATMKNMNAPNDSSRYWVKYSEVLETKLASVK